jgi:hypothetical protein
MSFGVLTLATSSDYRKAIALALSVRVSNPGVPIAVACFPEVRPLVTPYFDYVTDQDRSVRGYEHKIHLDRYSPFEETFFFDSDVLVFREVSAVLDGWRAQPFTACGNYVTGGVSPFGLDRTKALKLIGADKLVHIDGAGHYYFRKPDCDAVFDLARSVARDLREYAVNPDELKFADEDVMDIVMTRMNLKPVPHGEFWSRYCTGRSGTMVMDVARGECQFVSATSGKIQRPFMMHFAAREAPFAYVKQLRRLFKKFNVSTKGLLRIAVADCYVRRIEWPLKMTGKRWLTKVRLLGVANRIIGRRALFGSTL